MKINVFYDVKMPAGLRKTKLFKTAVCIALGRRVKFEEVNLVFVSGPEIRRINKKFLGHDYETDVISFANPPSGADIFVCPKIARKNAAAYKQSVLEELLTYAVHGALHLAGMDDTAEILRRKMDAKTAKIIKSL